MCQVVMVTRATPPLVPLIQVTLRLAIRQQAHHHQVTLPATHRQVRLQQGTRTAIRQRVRRMRVMPSQVPSQRATLHRVILPRGTRTSRCEPQEVRQIHPLCSGRLNLVEVAVGQRDAPSTPTRGAWSRCSQKEARWAKRLLALRRLQGSAVGALTVLNDVTRAGC